ncbi:MAG: ABC transporter permease, partial [Acidobacteriota bacterium]
FTVLREHAIAMFRFNSHTLEERDLLSNASALESLALYNSDTATLFDGSTPRRVDSAQIDERLLDTLGFAPLLGQAFTASDLGSDVVLLSERIWRDRFGGNDPIGLEVEIDDRPHRIVGVLPDRFAFPEPTTQLWVPLRPTERGGSSYRASLVARLKSKVVADTATLELETLASQKAEEANERGDKILLTSLAEELSGTRDRSALTLLMCGVGLLLLSACANAGNLALTQATDRSDELAIRKALGASRTRLARLFLTENLILCLAAGLAGLALASVAVPTILRLAPEAIRDSAGDASVLHSRVLAFSLCVASLSVAATGGLPMLRALARRRRIESNRSTRRIGTAFAAVQVGLGFLLLCAAGLILRSFERLVSVDPGFATENVLAIDLEPSTERYSSPATRNALFEELRNGVAALPGIETVSFANNTPPQTGVFIDVAPEAEGLEPIGAPMDPFLPWINVAPGYFRLMQIPILRGRGFREAEGEGHAVLSRTLAERLFGDDIDPVGRRVRVSSKQPWMEVVGVAEDVKQTGPADSLSPLEIYTPLAANPRQARTLLVKTPSAPLDHLPAVRDAIWQVDDRLPLSRIRTLEEDWQKSMTRTRFLLEILGLLAALTLILAFGGLYGVLSYAVVVRRREIGLRLALGARRRSVQWLVVRQALTAAALGLLASGAVAYASGELLQQQLFETSPLDPSVLAVASIGILLLVAAAAWLPTTRATTIDPGDALRDD